MATRISDLIMARLYEKYKIRYISLITGNGALVLNDALANSPITPICVHNEVDAGYFALGFSKYLNKLSVVIPTTGCASTNCISPLLSAYQDHAPILFLSGNVALKQTTFYQRTKNHLSIRKMGAQESDIIEIVKSITKYSKIVDDPKFVIYELDKAIDIALTPPFGPVWIDLPSDISSATVEESDIVGYTPNCDTEDNRCRLDILSVIDQIKSSKRTLVLAGNGINLSNTRKQFKSFIEDYQIPSVFSYGGVDLLDHDHPLRIGIIGVKGTRPGNFALQACDLLLVLGSSLNTPQIGYEAEKFAPQAKKIVVDVDSVSYQKSPPNIDQLIQCDLRSFFNIACNHSEGYDNTHWIKRCGDWKEKWTVFQKSYEDESQGINIYQFIESLNSILPEDAIIVSDAGSSLYTCGQALKLKNNQRWVSSFAQAEMGAALGMACGVFLASEKKPTIVIQGDGSFNTNIQALSIIRKHNLPIKIFILNNNGYLSIKNSQDKFYNGRRIGTCKDDGLFFPDIEKIASAHQIAYFKVIRSGELEKIMKISEPVIVEIMCKELQDISPSITASRNSLGILEQNDFSNMHPFLSLEEIEREKIND